MTTRISRRLAVRALGAGVLGLAGLAAAARAAPDLLGPECPTPGYAPPIPPPSWLGERYVVLVVLDGTRPEYLDAAPTPNLHRLMASGVSYERAWVGQFINNTPPSHVTLGTGMLPRHHGVIHFFWRTPSGALYRPTDLEPVQSGEHDRVVAASGVPRLGERFKQRYPDARTVAVGGSKFFAVAGLAAGAADYVAYGVPTHKCPTRVPLPNRVQRLLGIAGIEGAGEGEDLLAGGVDGRVPRQDQVEVPRLTLTLGTLDEDDLFAAEQALDVVRSIRPELLLVNFPATDHTAHLNGFARPALIQRVVAHADAQLGRIMEAYEKAGLFERTIWAVTADHGMTPNSVNLDRDEFVRVLEQSGTQLLGGSYAHYWLKDPHLAARAAEGLAARSLPGVHGIYFRQPSSDGITYRLTPASQAAMAPDLDAAYQYLLGTYALERGPDLVAVLAENHHFSERDPLGHGQHGDATWATQHVPLILAGPGIRRGVVSRQPARLVDVAPTLLAAVGGSYAGMDGVVLADALESPSDRQALAQQRASAELQPHQDALVARSQADLAALGVGPLFV